MDSAKVQQTLAGLFGLVGIAVIAIGVYALIRGRIRKLRITTRAPGMLLVIGGFVVLAVGGALTNPPKPAKTSGATKSSPRAGHSPKLLTTPAAVKSRALVSPSSSPASRKLKYSVYERKNISFDFGEFGGSAKRLSILVEIHLWPITKKEVSSLANRLVQREKGKGWQAINIFMSYDRREAVPAFGHFEWAPGGKWADAQYGDAETWDGYAFNVELQPKFDPPAECKPPLEDAFVYEGEFNEAYEEDDPEEDVVIADIAKRHGESPENVRRLIEAVEAWSFC